MRYLIENKNIIDVTKAPYNVDNTGKIDCTKNLCKVFDDILMREVEGIWETWKKLEAIGKNNTYLGFEVRMEADFRYVVYPEFVPPSRIIYFPAGTYLVSDTVTYTIKNLQNIFKTKPFFELARGIHVLGESKDSVVIKLADHSSGYETDKKKPVISFINAEGCCERPCSNVSQMNTIEDLTIDCGAGNPGAVGLRFIANNTGRIQNLNIRADEGYTGIMFASNSMSSVNKVEISGFEYGMVAPLTQVTVVDNADLSKNKIRGIRSNSSYMVCKNVDRGNLPLFQFDDGIGMYYLVDEKCAGQGPVYRNAVYIEDNENPLREMKIPENNRSENPEDWVCVDDFGAIGDGKTDCTAAIQAAFNSGKPIVLFGEGHYLVNGEITVPATVKTIDFMFCDMFSGEDLINGKSDGLFCIHEDSDDLLFIENLYCFDQLHGHFRVIKHAAKRDIVMSDLHTQAAAMYFNTLPGSKVYLDNCGCTTGTYSRDTILRRVGFEPEYCYLVPFEFHGQTVYGKLVNPERADVEILNDGSDILLDGVKLEGPGTLIKTINGGRTQANIMAVGIGKFDADNALIETYDSDTLVTGMRFHDDTDIRSFNIIIRESFKGVTSEVGTAEIKDVLNARTKRVNRYRSGELENLS